MNWFIKFYKLIDVTIELIYWCITYNIIKLMGINHQKILNYLIIIVVDMKFEKYLNKQ